MLGALVVFTDETLLTTALETITIITGAVFGVVTDVVVVTGRWHGTTGLTLNRIILRTTGLPTSTTCISGAIYTVFTTVEGTVPAE
mgnify:CR=1 FL=1